VSTFTWTEEVAMRALLPFTVITVGLLALTPPAFAQQAPPIPGVTGTIVTPETAKDEKKAEDKAGSAVKGALTPDDTKGPLADLRPGTTVVIRHADTVTEGIVSKIDRGANEITVRYDNKKIEKLVLTKETSPDVRTVEYSVDAQHKVTRYFRLKT